MDKTNLIVILSIIVLVSLVVRESDAFAIISFKTPSSNQGLDGNSGNEENLIRQNEQLDPSYEGELEEQRSKRHSVHKKHRLAPLYKVYRY